MAILIALLFVWIIKEQKLFRFKWAAKSLDIKYILPAIFILAIVVGYTVVIKVQVSAGFPKYHYPLFSFFFIMLGIALVQSNIRFRAVDIVYFIITLFVVSLLTKDILLPFYELGRAKQMNLLFVLLAKTFLIMSLPIILYYLIRKKTIIKTLPDFMMVVLVFALVINFSGFIYRSQADYATNYHYGISGTDEALAYARKIPMDQSVYFPWVGIWVPQPESGNVAVWGRLLGADALKPETDFIIMTDTMLDRGDFFFGIDYVKEKYERILTIKSYGIWKKREE